ncbi:hypothetical protein [Pelagicoccus sp. SDUM812002]|uniref:hypothetical protein n=1 Tax=Pelagicoccus sp. SDUM812002 TaxID=3041266 RepID=UPI00280DD3A1|nr:hypothetical protein [Pelagicoccus sp. SDUM812002]MDQ8185386.1 hypothetical protein [Pelagicoccus sp. SDUM812002]
MTESKTRLPKNIELVPDGEALVIRRTWRSGPSYFLIAFSLFWDLFIVVWFTAAIREEEWGTLAFGMIHLLFGLGISYLTLAYFLNKTDIRIDTNNLTISHAPIPWSGTYVQANSEIDQLHSKERVHQRNNMKTYYYDLVSRDKSGTDKKLLIGLTDKNQALYLEKEIEKTLGIKNRTIEGQI